MGSFLCFSFLYMRYFYFAFWALVLIICDASPVLCSFFSILLMIKDKYKHSCLFLWFRSYEAEVAFLDVKSVDPIVDKGLPESGTPHIWRLMRNPKKVVCQVDCVVCRETLKPSQILKNDASTSHIYSEDSRWLRSKGRFLSVGAALISCRNERAPDGLVADAHLSDGFLHLILIKDCPRTFYLW